jgi:signal transduction histidine kinase
VIYLLLRWRVSRIEAQKRLLQVLVDKRTGELAQANAKIRNYNERLEVMLEERTRHLIISERQAAFGQLVQGIVHNLKNPLASSTMSIDMIRMALDKAKPEKYKTPDEQNIMQQAMSATVSRAIGWIEQANEALNQMITSLLTKSRSDKGDDKRIVNINDLIKTEIDFLSADRRLKKMKNKKIELADEPLYVNVVRGELTQAFQNLVQNALDAMHKQPDPFIGIKTYSKDDKVYLSVSDNGPGIKEEIKEKIFDPFFSTKPAALDEEVAIDVPKGTGLGLWMCQQAMESFDGKIEVESEDGKGTTFTIILPVAVKNEDVEKEVLEHHV